MKLNSLKVALFFITTLSILAILVGFLVYKNTLISLGVWNDSNKMLVFLKTDTDEKQKNSLIEEIKALPPVSSVNVVDRATAGSQFQKSLKEYSNGLITNDELIDLIPETLEIDLESNLGLKERKNIFDGIAEKLKKNEAIDELSYSSNWIEKFEQIDKFVRSAGLFVFVILTALMSYLVSLMMRVYIDDSKSEIEVYNLLGATRWSIYKLYFKDLIVFVSFSLGVALVFSFVLFSYFKNFLSESGLSKLISDNMVYLKPTELAALLIVLLLVIFSHSFVTISSSVNKLNQINND
ncbi:MAG: cell division protein FtsX [Pseudobdellovibrio sp.]